MNVFKSAYETPIGWLQIVCSDTALCELYFLNSPNVPQYSDPNPITSLVVTQVSEYLNGTRQLFQIPMVQSGSPFQQAVWQLLQHIPYAKTESYMGLAKRYGDVKAIRAVAAANGKNKLAIVVPCHRVIGSNQSLTGYAGGLWRKQWLLAHEASFGRGVQTLF